MVFGTFDLIHPGHRHFFKQAKALAVNTELIVSLARDANVVRIKKRWPDHNETIRLQNIEQLPEVNRAVLGDLHNYMQHIITIAPDIIALGYDQTEYVENLTQDLQAAGLHTQLVRLKPHKPHLYKTSIIRKHSSDPGSS